MEFESEIRERLTVTEQSVKSAHHRIDTLDKLVDSVHKLAQQAISLALEVKNLREDVNSVSRQVSDLEAIPRSRYSFIIRTVITVLISAVAGFMTSSVLK